MGLDYSGGHERFKSIQQSVFRRLLMLAVELNKPVIIHCQDAKDDCLQIVTEVLPLQWKIHLHCYTNNGKNGRNWCKRFPNLCIGLTPLITWNVPELVELARMIPLDRLLLKTDSPYFLSRLSSPSLTFINPTMAEIVGQEVARIRGLRVEDVLSQCCTNTVRLFGVKFG